MEKQKKGNSIEKKQINKKENFLENCKYSNEVA